LDISKKTKWKYRIFHLSPLLLFIALLSLHIHTLLLAPAEIEKTTGIGVSLIQGVVLITYVSIITSFMRDGFSIRVMNIFLLHRYVPLRIAMLSYVMLLLSLFLACLSLQAEFHPLRRVSALWMLMLSYPSLVYWYLNSERMRLGGIE
jgi:hypothetical protein